MLNSSEVTVRLEAFIFWWFKDQGSVDQDPDEMLAQMSFEAGWEAAIDYIARSASQSE